MDDDAARAARWYTRVDDMMRAMRFSTYAELYAELPTSQPNNPKYDLMALRNPVMRDLILLADDDVINELLARYNAFHRKKHAYDASTRYYTKFLREGPTIGALNLRRILKPGPQTDEIIQELLNATMPLSNDDYEAANAEYQRLTGKQLPRSFDPETLKSDRQQESDVRRVWNTMQEKLQEYHEREEEAREIQELSRPRKKIRENK